MRGKTHLAGGLALTMLITSPDCISDMAVCLTSAAIGSVISDVDVSTSNSHRELNRVLVICGIAVTAAALIEGIFKIGLVSQITSNSGLMQILLGITAFLIICMYGQRQPHRTFMHSFLGILLLSASVYLIFPKAVIYFVIAMLSHIALDLLNYKKVWLLYPSKKMRLSFKLCTADSVTDTVIFNIAVVLTAIEIILLLKDIIF